MNTLKILGTHVHPVSLEDCLHKIEKAIELNQPLWIVTANPEMIYLADKNEKLKNTINSADLSVPDGIGVLWAARVQGTRLKERVTGVDLAFKILQRGNQKGWKVFFLGAKPGVAEEAIGEQCKHCPGIKFESYHGFFTEEDEDLVKDKIKRFAPDILLVGLGIPRQEYWLSSNRNLAKVCIGVGGTIDVMAGRVKRAPQFFQITGLEWLFRLVKEPSRLKRQKVLPLYLLKVIVQNFKQRFH